MKQIKSFADATDLSKESPIDLSKMQDRDVYVQQPTKELAPFYETMDSSFHGVDFILGFVLAFAAMFLSKKMLKL